MWANLRTLWQYTNPRSTAYNFMEEPLKAGEVWIAFDHTALLLPAQGKTGLFCLLSDTCGS